MSLPSSSSLSFSRVFGFKTFRSNRPLIIFCKQNLITKGYKRRAQGGPAHTTETMATTAATNAPWTRQPEDREQRMHEQHATEASPCSFWPMRPSLIELCAYYNRLLWQVMLLEQHPYFVQRRSRASGYRRPCSSRAWSISRVGTLPSFFRVGRRLYRSWTVHQCWCSTSTVDLYAARILRLYSILVLPEKSEVCLFFSLLLSLVYTGPQTDDNENAMLQILFPNYSKNKWAGDTLVLFTRLHAAELVFSR